ncbi:polyubiquitin-like [Contarinia nasturtii]|uniref:polyubiquitin-like n=1 Tax=Contarinia nasturtii TaxID=265458 RepID=UPI0012D38027|nr:polyubiquitin-like [Contarinia nasturtii]
MSYKKIGELYLILAELEDMQKETRDEGNDELLRRSERIRELKIKAIKQQIDDLKQQIKSDISKLPNNCRVHVKTLTGKALTIKCCNGLGMATEVNHNPSDTVEMLKLKILLAEDIPVTMQRLIFRGKQLEDGKTIEECGIENNSTVHFYLRLRGC